MNSEDVQPPEYIINRMHRGVVQKVPFLYQREGEKWEDFCERMKRVSDSLNVQVPVQDSDATMTISRWIMMILAGLLFLWAAWMLVR